MSLNHYSRNINYQNDIVSHKESLFEKTLTPSDVGKLNRLVIPKQHAEKYFPINNDVATETTEKGLLLSFEDETGKCWKFRYSYWNSSQSYVLTKGWSRYVKDKHLQPGDVVFFQRHRFDLNTLFIGWRRRGEASSSSSCVVSVVSQVPRVNTTPYWNAPYRQLHASTTYPNIHQEYSHGAVTNQAQSTPTVVSGSSRTVRLFGVNLECHGDTVEPPPCPNANAYNGQHIYYYSTHHPMNITFVGEAMEQVVDGRG